MKKSKLIIITILVIAIISVIYLIIINLEKKSQDTEDEYQNYIPQEEISESQSRQTIVTLYFASKDTREIATEARLIDAITLINNPYEELINLLIQGPKNEKLDNFISKETQLNSATINEGCVTIDFSEEFLNSYETDEDKYKVINSIVNTLTELTEVDSVEFLISGAENNELNETYARIQ